MKHNSWIHTLFLVLLMGTFSSSFAWDLHTLIAYPTFSAVSGIADADSVEVRSLETFLLAVESELEATLEGEEQWSRTHLEWYGPLPEALFFQATGDTSDIRQRFLKAIRINPDSRLIPYSQLLPGQESGARTVLSPEDITPLRENRGLENVTFVSLNLGETIDPLSILVTATDEPDMGLDVGLYEDNGTEAGNTYGFGTQPFGNPNLEYSSQAPFHMGLYHESKLIQKLAPIVKQCYPEHRIHLYKTLSKLAFSMGEDYWGWRFMGWGLHYLADLTQPYHASALPALGSLKIVTFNVLDIVGISGPKENAIQLMSNRHTAIEAFERQLLENAYLNSEVTNRQFLSLAAELPLPVYHDGIPREVITRAAYDRAKALDRNIGVNFPASLVSDAYFELGSSDEQYELLEIVRVAAGEQKITAMETQLLEYLQDFVMYGRSYTESILSKTSKE